MLINTEAFVLKSRKFNEADSMLVLFSRKLGKASAVAKGSRRAKSKMLAGIQPFCYSDFMLYKGRNLYTVTQVEAKRIFYPLREDYNKLTYACYLVELVETEITEGQTHPQLFSLFGKGLTLLSNPETIILTLIRSFELHFMTVCGYEPMLNQCMSCQTHESTGWWFNLTQGGILCIDCRQSQPEARKISANCIKLARYLLAKKIDETVRLKIHPSLNNELQEHMKVYMLHHLDRYQFKSLKMLEQTETLPVLDKKYAESVSLTDTIESDTFNENNHIERNDDQDE